MGSIQYDEDDSNPHVVKPLDPEEYRKQAYKVVDFIADYYKNIERFPVLSQVQPGFLHKNSPQSAPNAPETLESILQDVQRYVVPGITHWQSPNFFAYFPASNSTAALLGEMLDTCFNVIGFTWISSPAATELEMVVMDWFGEMLKLPKSFLFSGGTGGGVQLGTTCEAILCTLVAARDQKLKQVGRDKFSKLVIYGSDQTHMSFEKAAMVAGFGPESFRAIKTTKSEAFALSPVALKIAIQSDIEKGLIPLFLCATVGTTSTNAVDPLVPLCDVAKQYDIWVHVDAAYAGSACICPEFRHFIDGVENADSFSLNAHKWFFSAPDCCCLWLKNPLALNKSLSLNPHYLHNKATDSSQVVDYKNWQITLSRRFRAIKLWVVIKSYGASNLRNFLRQHVMRAKLFEELVLSDKRFEVVAPRNFGLVCFRLTPSAIGKYGGRKISDESVNGTVEKEKANTVNKKLLESINASGKAHMTHAMVEGMHVIRFSVGATLLEERHIVMAWKVVEEHANRVLRENGK